MRKATLQRLVTYFSILTAIIVNGCENPVQPSASRFLDADSVWVSMTINNEQWTPDASYDHFTWLQLNAADQRLRMVALSLDTNNGVLQRCSLQIIIDSVTGAGEYQLRSDGPARLSFTDVTHSNYRAIDGQITITVFDTLVINEVRGTLSALTVNKNDAADTLMIAGEFVADWW